MILSPTQNAIPIRINPSTPCADACTPPAWRTSTPTLACTSISGIRTSRSTQMPEVRVAGDQLRPAAQRFAGDGISAGSTGMSMPPTTWPSGLLARTRWAPSGSRTRERSTVTGGQGWSAGGGGASGWTVTWVIRSTFVPGGICWRGRAAGSGRRSRIRLLSGCRWAGAGASAGWPSGWAHHQPTAAPQATRTRATIAGIIQESTSHRLVAFMLRPRNQPGNAVAHRRGG